MTVSERQAQYIDYIKSKKVKMTVKVEPHKKLGRVRYGG